MNFIIDLAVVSLLYIVVWYIFSFLIIAIVIHLFPNDIISQRALQLLGSIVLSSLYASVILLYSDVYNKLYGYTLLAILFLLLHLFTNYTHTRRTLSLMVDNLDSHKLRNQLKYEYLYYLISIVTLSIVLTHPGVTLNPVNNLFMKTLEWIYSIGLIKWIIIFSAITMIISRFLKAVVDF